MSRPALGRKTKPLTIPAPTTTEVVMETLGDKSLERRIGKRQEGFLNRDGASPRRYAAHFARAATSDEVSDFTIVLKLGAAEA